MTTTAATTAPTVRVRDTRDLLSVVPYALGYRPTECVLVVCVRHGGGLGLVARTDLADLRGAADRAHVATLVAARAGEDGTVSAWVILYTADDAEPGSAARAAADAFSAALDEVVPERESWVVGPDRYRSLDCGDPLCCPPEGYPSGGLESTAPGAQLVLAGVSPLPSRDALYRVPRADQARRNLAGRAAGRWERARTEARDAGPGEESAWRSRSFDAWCEATAVVAAGRTPGPALLGRLAAALEDRWVRDAVLVSFVPGGEAHAAAVALGDVADDEADAAVGEAIAAVVDPASARRPDEDRARTCVAVLEQVVAHAARRRTAAPLTLLSFLAWWSGEGARASYRNAEALAVDPEYRLALLVAAALDAALPPGWVRARGVGALEGGIGDDLG